MAVKGKGLGKGLDSLIPAQKISENKVTAKTSEVKEVEGPVSTVKITKVEPNREQPRKVFDKEKLEELADNIKQHGIIEPLIVQDRKTYYEIIAGERRWRAAKIAGLKEVPVVIKNYTEQEIVEISLIENIQREDLNPIEEALAYKKLMTEFTLTQEDVAKKVSKSRAAVTNAMRLLKLSDKVQEMIATGKISSGHARALLAVEEQETQDELADKIVSENLSVRDIEKIVKNIGKKKPAKKDKHVDESLENIYQDIAEKLRQTLSTKVAVSSSQNGDGSGKIELEFYSHDDMDRIIEQIMK